MLCAVTGAIGVLQSHVPHQSHMQQQQMGAFQYSAFNAAAQVPQMDALEMHLAGMQGMPGYGRAPLEISNLVSLCLAVSMGWNLLAVGLLCIP